MRRVCIIDRHSPSRRKAKSDTQKRKCSSDFGNKRDDAGARTSPHCSACRRNRARVATRLRCDNELVAHGVDAVDFADDLRDPGQRLAIENLSA
jgi:hypothetical protein